MGDYQITDRLNHQANGVGFTQKENSSVEEDGNGYKRPRREYQPDSEYDREEHWVWKKDTGEYLES